MDEQVITEFENIVGTGNFISDKKKIESLTQNTLNIKKNIHGIIYPETVEHVLAIVKTANRNKVPLYPYSKARNIGYGERLPVTDDNLIVDMGRMNRIIYVDPDLGYADVEPGVTQWQLCKHLQENKIPFFMDTTGSARDSSLVGNVVEGGFGTSPKGNRRKEISCVKGVLGNGEFFETGAFPGSIGPNLSGVFVQSNFAIVTQLRVQLNPVVESYQSFTINVHNDSDLIPLVDTIRTLRLQNTIINQVVILNALDVIAVSAPEIPEKFKGMELSNKDANEIMSTPLFQFGAIASIGSIYGSKAEVNAKKKVIKKAIKKNLNGKVTIRFMDDKKLHILLKILKTWPLNKFGFSTQLLEGLELFSQSAHRLMKGIPTDKPFSSLLGGVKDTYGDKGLMWYSSNVSSLSKDVSRYFEIARRCYKEYQFGYPFEMLFATPNDIVAIQKIEWDRDNPKEEQAAKKLYDTLSGELKESGFSPYRLGIQSQEALTYSEDRSCLLHSLKSVLDPNGIISPGRYGIKN
jgi:4-cresol dehydrogenase (hydroxylating)